MGKLRFKLFHVMPHVWFYKQKEILGRSDSNSHSESAIVYRRSSSMRLLKSGSATEGKRSAPVNHKAFDISFPETPMKKSKNRTVKADKSRKGRDIQVCTVVDAGCTCRATVTSHRKDKGKAARGNVGGNASTQAGRASSGIGSLFGCNYNEDMVKNSSSAVGVKQDTKEASLESTEIQGSQICLDIRELECRLRSLGTGDRKKCQSSPECLARLPSPVHSGSSQESLDMLDYACENSFLGAEDHASTMLSTDDQGSFSKSRIGSNASSCRPSTSAADTAFEGVASCEEVRLYTNGGSLFAAEETLTSSQLLRNLMSSKHQAEKTRIFSPDEVFTGNGSALFRQRQNDLYRKHSRGSREDQFDSDDQTLGLSMAELELKRKYPNPLFCKSPCEKPTRIEEDVEGNSLPVVECESNRRDDDQGVSMSRSDRLLTEESEMDSAISHKSVTQKLMHQQQQRKSSRLQRRVSTSASAHSTAGQFVLVTYGEEGQTEHLSPEAEDARFAASRRREARAKGKSRRGREAMISAERVGSIMSNGDDHHGSSKGKSSFHESSPEIRPHNDQAVFDSVAMVKSSYDPQQDFRESMIEMVLEKELHSSEDLEQLLQCYLSLNSEQYHEIIIKVFREVWSDMFHESKI